MYTNDQALIDATVNGSHTAFEQLMCRYERLVYGIGISYAKQPESARDISQNVFIKVYNKLESFKGTSSFKSWLIRIAQNESVNWLRSQKRFANSEELNDLNIPSLQPVQEQSIGQAQQRQMLLAEIMKLNPRQQQAVMLRYFEKLPVREIAETLECSEPLVKNILFRSLQKLRKQMPQRREMGS